MLANQQQSPRYVFSEKVREVTTSGHYSARGLTPAVVESLDLEVMRRIHRERFGNAADFTFFIAGAFAEADVVPMVEQWLASLPSSGPPSAAPARRTRPRRAHPPAPACPSAAPGESSSR